MLAVGSHSDERGWRANRLVSDIQVHKKKIHFAFIFAQRYEKSLQLVERPKKFENKDHFKFLLEGKRKPVVDFVSLSKYNCAPLPNLQDENESKKKVGSTILPIVIRVTTT